MKRVCLLVALASVAAAAAVPHEAAADPSLCPGELEALRRDHKRLRAQHAAAKADLETRPTKKAHDKLAAAHEALRNRFKNAPKKSSVARMQRDLDKWRERAEKAEAELAARPSAREHERLQAQVDALQHKLRAAEGTVEGAEGYDKVRWGMKPSAVKRAYDGLKEHGDALQYRTKIAARNAVVRFSFARDKLARVDIELGVDDDDAMVAFNRTGKLLTKKYGAPKQRNKQWNDKRHKGNKAEWNAAIRNGELVLTATWETDDTRVILTSHGSGGNAQEIIRYTSKELAPIIKVENERKLLRGL